MFHFFKRFYMVLYSSFYFPCGHCFCIEMQLTFVCFLCICMNCITKLIYQFRSVLVYLVYSLGFFYVGHHVNHQYIQIISSFPISMSLFPFSCLVELPRYELPTYSCNMLNSSGDRKYHCIIPNL